MLGVVVPLLHLRRGDGEVEVVRLLLHRHVVLARDEERFAEFRARLALGIAAHAVFEQRVDSDALFRCHLQVDGAAVV